MIIRQDKVDLMCKFTEVKPNNPKLTQKEIAKRIGFPDSTLSRYRKGVIMTSPYKSNIPRKNVTVRQNTSKYATDRQREVSKNVTDCQNTSKYVKIRQDTIQQNDEGSKNKI